MAARRDRARSKNLLNRPLNAGRAARRNQPKEALALRILLITLKSSSLVPRELNRDRPLLQRCPA